MKPDRRILSALLVDRVSRIKEDLRRQFLESGRVNTFVIDDTLPDSVARQVSESFPGESEMARRASLREKKYVSSQMNLHDPLLEEVVYAFQDAGFTKLLGEITGLNGLEPDPELYASGLSLMTRGDFLNPHLDNSHDRNRVRYRVLNVLYYVSPDWRREYGGSLELWDEGPRGKWRTIPSQFNRTVCMITHPGSWHSVDAVTVNRRRRCISNYYFSPQPALATPYFHVTSFRGRPEQPVLDLALRMESAARSAIRVLFPRGLFPVWHAYKRDPARK
jgi:Rps23 Pro-64 3,4-dihydroxylase Tpa1-like proline 4-hydroxylase